MKVARRLGPYLVRRFLRAPGYRLMVLARGEVPLSLDPLGPQLPLGREALRALDPSVSASVLRATLIEEGIPDVIAQVLKPCGDVAGDLDDHGFLEYHARVVRSLERGKLLQSLAPRGLPEGV